MSRLAACVLGLWMLGIPVAAEETIGKRPYEMEWARRTDDLRPALIDFENLDGWTVECQQAEAALTRSREQQLWGQHVGKLVYRGSGTRPVVLVKPPRPIPLPKPFDCLNFWVYGNNWAWKPDAATPQVEIAILLRGPDAQPVRVALGNVRWQEWFVMHRKLDAEQIAALGDAPTLEAIEITKGRNTEDRVLYFDNLSVYQEVLRPLTFEPRPERGITLFAGQSPGTNTGPGRLPFPNRETTILPDQLVSDFQVTLEQTRDAYRFGYRGSDGQLVYTYRPQTGTLADVTAQWEGRTGELRPMVDGGVWLVGPDGQTAVLPQSAELIRCQPDGDTLDAVWRLKSDVRTVEVTYRLRLWQKSLVVDVLCPGGQVAEVRFGKATGVQQPRLVTLPYLACEVKRPAVLVMGPAESPCFLMGLVDHCRSSGSALFAENAVAAEGVTYNGGSRYSAKTDGQRNDCFERLFLTLSPRVEEVLPNVPNPQSPWMHVTSQRVWRAHGASVRENDYNLWKKVARLGMSQVLITDHETGWRDGGESFTFRTRAAPGKGGDEGQAEYAKKIQALGFLYGLYNNYTDYAPVNEHWDEDCVSRQPNGDWRGAWARCYNPKPARAVEFEARLAPIIEQKFHLDTAYCDVHTAVQPWRYCDFDARVPGAGTFAATFYAYGEIMLHQKQTWGGPVYSEGNNHWYYCGLTDGNYGQDQAARLDSNPWLVDFDLRKLHPLCCNFGMGNPGMFYTKKVGLGKTPQEMIRHLDRFLAATLAFGHTGFLVMEGGMPNAAQSYFSVQQAHARYALDTVQDVRYADADGKLWETSAAVANEAFRRSQLVVRYKQGIQVTVNGHETESWTTPHGVLPPNSWHVTDTKRGDLTAWSMVADGHRADYVDSPAYVYANGRGTLTRFAKAVCDGQMVALPRDGGAVEVIPVGKCTVLAVSLGGQMGTAEALDEERQSLGPAKTRFSRGLVHIEPMEKAFSYRLKPAGEPACTLGSRRQQVVPGESVEIVLQRPGQPPQKQGFRVPADARPGTLLWHQADEAWIEFAVAPLVEARLSLDEGLRLEIVPHVAQEADAVVRLAGQEQRVRLVPEQSQTLRYPLPSPTKDGQEEVRPLSLEVEAGELRFQRPWWLKYELSMVSLGQLPAHFEAGQQLRGHAAEPAKAENRAHVRRGTATCGGASREAITMHPPYKEGTGCVFALFDPIGLPRQTPAALRIDIGKGDGSDVGDGILYQVAVVAADGSESIVAQKQWLEHAWTTLEADLGPWAGQRIALKLVADVGPKDNSSGDWACWSEPRIESRQLLLTPSLHTEPVAVCHETGPSPLPKLTVDQLRAARRAVLHFQGIGLQSSGKYISLGFLNGRPLGQLPGAGGSEKDARWADAALAVPPEALATLSLVNHFSIANPGQDSFKIRRVWLELELADGRKASSLVTTTAYTQPATWLYAEGVGVPADEQIKVEILFVTSPAETATPDSNS